MASFIPLGKRLSHEKKTKWSHSFTWTAKHLRREDVEPLRHQYDELGARTLEKLLAIKEERNEKGDFYKLLQEHHEEDEILSQFWDQMHHVPEWVDWAQIERGQKFFYRYALANIIGFALQGFVCENSASSGVVEVLVRSGGFSTRVLWGRLLETFQWLLQITHDLAALQPGGEGHRATVRVRLLHSSVRHRILQLAKRRPGYFDLDRFGIPVNTLDSIHSISTFACNPMWLQLPRMGITPHPDEIEDYIALFRYVAHLLATPTEYFETPERAKAVMESCYVNELHMTDTSQIVAYNFVRCMESLPPPISISRGFIEAGSRCLNGHQVCDELDLGRPGLFSYVVFAGQCVLVTGLAWTQRLIPRLDEWMIKTCRDKLYWAVIESKEGLKGGTNFEMKYVPKEGRLTKREEALFKTGESSLGLGWIESIFLLALLLPLLSILSLGILVWGISWSCFWPGALTKER